MGFKQRIDMTGRRYGRLVGVAYSHTVPCGRAHWLFACDCGSSTVADGGNVRAGTTTSCGCHHRKVSAERLTTHGHRAARRHEPTYRAWQRWRGEGGVESFEDFLGLVGERPLGTVLARRDPVGASGAANACWVANESREARARRGWLRRRADAVVGTVPTPNDARPAELARLRGPDQFPQPRQRGHDGRHAGAFQFQVGGQHLAP